MSTHLAAAAHPQPKLVRLVAVALIAAAVALGTLFSPASSRASAQAGPGAVEALFGTVLEVTPPSTISVVTGSGTQAVTIGPDTVLRAGPDLAQIEDVQPGDRVVATVSRQEDGTLLGLRVLVTSGAAAPASRHIVGVVIDATDVEITVQDRDGNTITVSLPSGIDLPAIGDAITAVATLDPKTQRFILRTFERATETVDRLKKASDNAGDDDKARKLRDLLEEARQRHLSAIEEARMALERAREATELARKRLQELEERFKQLSAGYASDAASRGEHAPVVRARGTWAGFESATFTINTTSGQRTFSVNRETTAAGIAIGEDGVQIVICDPCGEGVNLPRLEELFSKVPAGALLHVGYTPDGDVPLAKQVVFVRPELPREVADDIELRERGLFAGVITLVEPAGDQAEALGIIVVGDEQSNRKALVRITPETEIAVDGEPAGFGDLAAGQKAEVLFDLAVIHSASGANDAAARGLLNARAVRTWTTQSPDETHISGLIRDISVEDRVIVVLTRQGDLVKALVPEQAEIHRDGDEARFSDLRVGDLVLDATRYIRSTSTIVRLVVHSAEPSNLAGVITGIEMTRLEVLAGGVLGGRSDLIEGLKVTVSSRNSGNTTVLVTRETKLTSRLDPAMEPSDLKVGDVVLEGKVLTVVRGGVAFNFATVMVIGLPEIAAARGVVTRVDAPSGTLAIRTRDGADLVLQLPVPSTKASLFKNDRQISSLAPVIPGDIVEGVTYLTGDNTIIKMAVVSSNLARTTGRVESVDAAGGVLVVATPAISANADAAVASKLVTLRVTADTRILVNGREVQSLAQVLAGDFVSSAVYLHEAGDRSRGVALGVSIVARREGVPGSSPARPGTGVNPQPVLPPARVEATVTGPITAIEPGMMEIGGRKFIVNEKTQYFGARPEVGLVAKAALVAADNGAFIATAVSVAGRPDTDPSNQPVDVRPVSPEDNARQASAWISGVIWAVEGRTVVISSVKFQLTEDTRVSGEIAPRKYAKAELTRTPEGGLIALQVIVGQLADATDPIRTPQPVITATPAPATGDNQGESQKVSGRLISIDEGSVVIGEFKCELRAGLFLTLAGKLGVNIRDLVQVLREKDVRVVAALRKLTTGVCVVDQIELAAPAPANPTPAPVPPTATPKPSLGTAQTNIALEKVSGRIDEVYGRVWRIGERVLVIPPRVEVEVKPGANVIVVVRKVDHQALAIWLDDLTVKQLLLNPLYVRLVINQRWPVYIIDEVHVEQVALETGDLPGATAAVAAGQ